MLPGTTAQIVDDLNKLEPKGVGIRSKESFVGGVSDGTFGVSTMNLRRATLTADKSYFYFDDSFLCLGAGINCESDNDVATTINQCHANGTIAQTNDLSWVHHDGVGYILVDKAVANLDHAERTGRWSDIGTGSSQPVTLPVFKLSIDHGPHPKDATYAYLVMPDATRDQTEARFMKPEVRVLLNTPKIQAVRHERLNMTMAVFREPGAVANISVDQPCLVMVRDKTITVANPHNKPLVVNVAVSNRNHKMALPDGDLAGSSLSIPD
jgi:chondroitin AC lyase